jgi:hypothetical protein
MPPIIGSYEDLPDINLIPRILNWYYKQHKYNRQKLKALPPFRCFHHSSILEIGLALVKESIHPLLLIMSRKQSMKQPSLKAKAFCQSHF